MCTVPRHLIATPDERTWRFDGPVLFLGEWCRQYDQRAVWEGIDAEVLPYHWDDRAKLYSDYKYLVEFYEGLLVGLVDRLNEIHCVKFSLRYWRILVGPWLASFVQIVFDRWSLVHDAISHHKIVNTAIMTQDDKLFVANDLSHFAKMSVGDEWNFYLFSEIVRKRADVAYEELACVQFLPCSCRSPGSMMKKFLLNLYMRSAASFSREEDVFVMDTYLPLLKQINLQLRLKQIPKFWRKIEPVSVEPDDRLRAWELPLLGKDAFEDFVLEQIPKQIPTVLLEGYRCLLEQVAGLPWPKKPKAVYSVNMLWYDTISMAYTADKVENGMPLVYGQHGGAYGTALFSFYEEHEIAISDRYLTWGWDTQSCCNIFPVGCQKVVNVIDGPFSLSNKLLFITIGFHRYSHIMSSEGSLNSDKYFQRCFSFVGSVHDSIIENIVVRLSPSGQLGDKSRWSDRFPLVQISHQRTSIYKLMKLSRLVVMTYNQTSFLEAIALGIPTVLFFDVEDTPLRPSSIPYYDDLRRVGVFHETPESAAKHVNMIWNDIDSWWSNGELRKVLNRFKFNYCRKSSDVVGDIINNIESVACG